jgi:4-amino-4-deoxy-L-arabinose transferase-like glycosyltransferase
MIGRFVPAAIERPERHGWGLFLVSLSLLLVWSVVVPVFESPDEPHHWQYARYLHDEWRLPIYGPSFVEANSPPLYYALVALVARSTPLPPPAAWHDSSGMLLLPFRPRLHHNAGGDFLRYWPIRLGRAVTAVMSALTVWLCYQAGLRLGGRSLALASASLVAFLPQFTFRGSSISNDALVTTMSAATVAYVVCLVRERFTWRAGTLAATCLSAAYLSKITAICLAAPLALAVWRSRGSVAERLTRLTVVMGLTAMVIAPWSMRNIVLYGDPFASAAMEEAVGSIVSIKPLTSPYFRTTLPSVLAQSFVGVFGWMNLPLPAAYYWPFGALGVLGLAGVGWRALARREDARLILVLVSIVLLNLAVVVHINRQFDQPQGRYLFASLPALALLVAMGLESLPAWSGHRRTAARTLAVIMVAVNVLILVRVIVPAYYPPVTPLLSSAFVRLDAPKSDEAEEAGYEGWRVTFETNLDAAQLAFLRFDVTGQSPEPNVYGTVSFTTDGARARDMYQIGFRWLANGTTQPVIVALVGHPFWRGRVTALRIDAIAVAAERHRGEPVRMEHVRVAGRLDRLDP